MRRFCDIHAHRLPPGQDPALTVLNLSHGRSLDEAPPAGGYSAGIHPWQADEADQWWPWLEAVVTDPRVVAIGECGIDLMRGPAPELQQAVLERHIALSEHVGKPLILHAVRSFDRLIALRKRYRPTQPWIVHGFRGKPEQARQLLSHGFSLSYGPRYNAASRALTPPDRLYTESDYQ